jgi:hypothetical protein
MNKRHSHALLETVAFTKVALGNLQRILVPKLWQFWHLWQFWQSVNGSCRYAAVDPILARIASSLPAVPEKSGHIGFGQEASRGREEYYFFENAR